MKHRAARRKEAVAGREKKHKGLGGKRTGEHT